MDWNGDTADWKKCLDRKKGRLQKAVWLLCSDPVGCSERA